MKSVVSLLAVAALFAVGCGSSNSSDDSGAKTAAPSADAGGLREAQANVDALLKTPTSVGLTAPISKAIPSGKTLDYITCGLAPCNDMGAALTDAGAALGWRVKVLQAGATPQTIQNAFAQAVRDKPDGVAYLGLPAAAFAGQLKQLEAAGVPVIAGDTVDPVGNGIKLVLLNGKQNEAEGVGIASKIIVDSGGDAHIGLVNLPAYPILGPVVSSFKATTARLCPSCSVKVLDLPQTAIGKDAPERIVNFVRANRDIRYIWVLTDDLTLGLSSAFAQAGLTGVKVYGLGPGKQNVQALLSGQETATWPNPNVELGWTAADAFARTFAGESIAPDEQWRIPRAIWTKDTIPSETGPGGLPVVVPGYEQQFRQLWGK